MDIFLFTTNIQKSDLERLRALLEGTSGIKKWTIDLDDCDHVLRIVCQGIDSDALQDKLNEMGFNCQCML
ncbi:hypothetical protein [Parachryseolinea silvisoli]|jgi:hypothetical protein|uniref:hypothetical protein n=1 Tax=Parachryseolinea silvisoli TaxID=2873601 RepID=UPI00226583B5|nr:hypothetical protein [Parachryseolinea silvisoli]MCD9015751.1 hypothetical protein [Parachryseolinea silvisoli]